MGKHTSRSSPKVNSCHLQSSHHRGSILLLFKPTVGFLQSSTGAVLEQSLPQTVPLDPNRAHSVIKPSSLKMEIHNHIHVIKILRHEPVLNFCISRWIFPPQKMPCMIEVLTDYIDTDSWLNCLNPDSTKSILPSNLTSVPGSPFLSLALCFFSHLKGPLAIMTKLFNFFPLKKNRITSCVQDIYCFRAQSVAA